MLVVSRPFFVSRCESVRVYCQLRRGEKLETHSLKLNKLNFNFQRWQLSDEWKMKIFSSKMFFLSFNIHSARFVLTLLFAFDDCCVVVDVFGVLWRVYKIYYVFTLFTLSLLLSFKCSLFSIRIAEIVITNERNVANEKHMRRSPTPCWVWEREESI